MDFISNCQIKQSCIEWEQNKSRNESYFDLVLFTHKCQFCYVDFYIEQYTKLIEIGTEVDLISKIDGHQKTLYCKTILFWVTGDALMMVSII